MARTESVVKSEGLEEERNRLRVIPAVPINPTFQRRIRFTTRTV